MRRTRGLPNCWRTGPGQPACVTIELPEDMPASDHRIDLIKGDDLTPAQGEFVNHWSRHFFGDVAVSRNLAKASVHWRLILREGEELLSQVAVTELEVEADGRGQVMGAVGGLFTPPHHQKNGFGNALMDEAERFIFEELKLPISILFCLPELVPFYAARGWSPVDAPVTLQQKDGAATWGAAVMVLSPARTRLDFSTLHVPKQTPKPTG